MMKKREKNFEIWVAIFIFLCVPIMRDYIIPIHLFRSNIYYLFYSMLHYCVMFIYSGIKEVMYRENKLWFISIYSIHVS